MATVDPISITIDGNKVEQKYLSTKVVKELINVRQKDAEKYPPLENISWLGSHAFFGKSGHEDEFDNAVPFHQFQDLFTNILEYNALAKPSVGEVTAAETP